MINIRSDNKELIERLINKHGVIPFTFNKKTLGGYKYTWTTSTLQYPDSMADPQVRNECFLGRIRNLGLQEPMMMDDTMKEVRNSKVIIPHVLSFGEVKKWKKEPQFKKDGTSWAIPKPWHAIFMSRATHDKIKRDLGLDISAVYPAGDCAVTRLYIPSIDTIGILHLSGDNLSKGVLDESIKFAKETLNAKPQEIETYVGAFASRGWVYKGKVPDWAALKDENNNIIVGPDGIPLLNPQWDGFIDVSRDDDGNIEASIKFEENLREKLKKNGISKDNISMCPDSTILDPNYRSNAVESKTCEPGKKPGSNLFGIDFLPEDKSKSLIYRRANHNETHIIIA